MTRLRHGCEMIIEYFSGTHRGSSDYVSVLVYATGIGPLSNTDRQMRALFEMGKQRINGENEVSTLTQGIGPSRFVCLLVVR